MAAGSGVTPLVRIGEDWWALLPNAVKVSEE
jgi:hypothetical protein